MKIAQKKISIVKYCTVLNETEHNYIPIEIVNEWKFLLWLDAVMPEAKFKHIVSCTSEDKQFPADNLLATESFKKWKCKSGTFIFTTTGSCIVPPEH